MGNCPDTDIDPLDQYRYLVIYNNTSSQRFNYWKRTADSKASRDLDRVGEIEFASFVRE